MNIWQKHSDLQIWQKICLQAKKEIHTYYSEVSKLTWVNDKKPHTAKIKLIYGLRVDQNLFSKIIYQLITKRHLDIKIKHFVIEESVNFFVLKNYVGICNDSILDLTFI